MERPNHLHVANGNASSKVTGLVIVVAIHVAAIAGLVVALNQGAIMDQLKEIQATVEADKTPPKAPPPPPPDLVKPPPPIAIVPDFTVASAPPPAPVTTAPKPPPAPPPAATVSNDPLRPIARTRTLPPYPDISKRLNESGTTVMLVNINAQGSVDECSITTSSSSERLDQAACDHVKRSWRWQPPTLNGQPTAAKARVSVKWDLKDAR